MLLGALSLAPLSGSRAAAPPMPVDPTAGANVVDATTPPPEVTKRLLQLGPGDSVAMQVYGQPDMSTTVYVADDGTLAVPLAGNVQVNGLSPSEAGRAVEKALSNGKFLIDPHVTLTVVQSRSQRVSVLGEVGTPGRYPIESTTTIFDLLAQAGGAKETASDTVYLLRPDGGGKVTRYAINLKGYGDLKNALPTQLLQGGDSVFVPRAPQFYIFGEVARPDMYRVEPGMTIVQAIARAGGITQRGSRSRFELKRKDASGVEYTVKAKLSDLVQPNDVIRIKESIF
jgi:polysaccharide export outer membrane protein